MDKINILFTSVGRRSYLVKFFREAMEDTGRIYVANSSEISPAFKFADGSVVTPLIYDKEYIPFLLSYCKENKINVVISLFDIDLPILSKNRDAFEKNGIKLIVSNYDIISICNDKWKTYMFLRGNGIDTPKTYLSIDNVKEDLDNGVISFPIIIKPRWGMGSIGVYEVENFEELDVLYKKALNLIKKSYLKYESSIDYCNCVIFQQKIIGVEYGLDIINDLDANYINTVVKKKIAMRSGETDCAITVNNCELKLLGETLAKVTKHIANMDVDVFLTENKIYVLEMNARFGGGYPFSHLAGVNLPLAIIKWVKGEKVDNSLLTENYNVLVHKDIELVEL